MTAPPASIALLSALLAPLSLGRSFEKGSSEARHTFVAFRDYALQRFHSCAYTACVFRSFESTFGSTVVYRMRLSLFWVLGIGLSVAFQKESSASHAVSGGQLSQKTLFPQVWRRPTNVDGFVPTLSAFFGDFSKDLFGSFPGSGQGRSGGRFPPGPVSLGRSFRCVWACVSWIWRARGVRHNFGTLTPSPIVPKICHYFGTFTPSPIFPKICHNFGTFHEYKLWELSFCVSVILNLPHATVALLNSL